MALFYNLIDDFTGNTRDATKWTQFGTTTTPSQATGDLVFTTTTTNGYGGYDATGTWATADLTGNYLHIRMLSAGNQALASLEIQSIGLTLDASNAMGWYLNTGTLAAWKKVATVRSNVATATYSATTHLWQRIRESAGTIYWDTSADGLTWVNFTTLANPFAITGLALEISVGTFSNEASGTTVTFDNFNIVPVRFNNRGLRPHPFSPGLAR